MHTTDIRTNVLVDRGPVAAAALILATTTTLAEHLTIHSDANPIEIEIAPDGIPFELWGSGTQALWRLLCAIAYTRHEVSLYEVVSRLDARNTAAVADAVAALCGVAR